jgi:hypothetical protein
VKELGEEPTPYWQTDVGLGEGHFYGEAYDVRVRLHRSQERYFGQEELVALGSRSDDRVYFNAQAYILEPRIALTIDAYAAAAPSGAIGEVESAEWEGMAHRQIGSAQAWYYQADRTLVLWECYLEEWCRQQDPTTDGNLQRLWNGFERLLLAQIGGARRIATPSWEDIYDLRSWRRFLELQGYQRLGQRSYLKEIAGQ